jgi:hypothetical protein
MTEGSNAFVTVTVKVRLVPDEVEAMVGAILTLIAGVAEGSSVIVVDADAVESARLVAVTVKVCAVFIVVGAVKRPDVLIEPTPTGVIDHVTALVAVLVTVAVNCAVWPLFSSRSPK